MDIDALLSAKSANGRSKRGPKLQLHLERIRALPRARQKFVIDVLESVLAQHAR